MQIRFCSDEIICWMEKNEKRAKLCGFTSNFVTAKDQIGSFGLNLTVLSQFHLTYVLNYVQKKGIKAFEQVKIRWAQTLLNTPVTHIH